MTVGLERSTNIHAHTQREREGRRKQVSIHKPRGAKKEIPLQGLRGAGDHLQLVGLLQRNLDDTLLCVAHPPEQGQHGLVLVPCRARSGKGW